MKRTVRIAILVIAALLFAGAPTAWASCLGITSQQIWHGLDGFVAACPDAKPVIAYTYALSSPATINSAAQAVACNDGTATLPTGLPCQPQAGVGDGIVTVYYEWGEGNTGSAGCPNPDQTGDDPIALQLVCNNGASVLLTVGFFPDTQQYTIELSGPDTGEPVTALFENGPSLAQFSGGAGSDTVCVTVPNPRVWSDCDPTSLGMTAGGGLSCTNPSSRPVATRGRLYSRVARCGTTPDPRISSGWALMTNNTNDGATPTCNNVPRPPVAPTPDAQDCTYVGASALLGAVETAAVVGSFQITGDAAANDKVKIDNAAFAQGRLVVGFSTTNETSIVGFNVYTGATKLNGNLITAKGAGSNAYSFEVGRGALKGGKSVLVEAVKSDGTVEKTAPVTLK